MTWTRRHGSDLPGGAFGGGVRGRQFGESATNSRSEHSVGLSEAVTPTEDVRETATVRFEGVAAAQVLCIPLTLL